MEAAPGMGPPMMQRVQGQVQGMNYGQILHETEQSQHQPANPQFQTMPQGTTQQQYPQYPQQMQYAPNPQQYYQQPQGQGQGQMQMAPQYNPTVMPVHGGQHQAQPQINFEGTAPWAGLPGCSAAFEAGPPLGDSGGGYSVVGHPGGGTVNPGEFHDTAQNYLMQQPSRGAKLSGIWHSFKDVIVVVVIVYLMLRYGLPQAKRFLPTVFTNFEASVPATAVLALCVGGLYQTSRKVI